LPRLLVPIFSTLWTTSKKMARNMRFTPPNS